MKLGKKFAVLSILILTIGLVTVLSLMYSTDNNMVATGQIVPWFGADMPYAYVNLYATGGNNTMTWDGASINGVLNFTLTPNAVDLVGAVAQIEFYRLHFYSDQGSIINMTYSVAVSGKVVDPNSPVGFDYAITGGSGGTYQFIDGTVFDGSALFGQGYGATVICNNMPEIPIEREYTVTVLSVALLDCFGEKDIQAVNSLRNAQTLYVDISRIGAVTYQGNSQKNQSSTNILFSNDLLYTTEFTKIDGGFICGTYIEDSVPFPMQVPNATPTPPVSQPFEESPFMTVYKLQPPPS